MSKMFKNIISIAKKILICFGVLALLVPVGFVGKAFPDKALAAGETSAVTKTSPSTKKVIQLTSKPTQLKIKASVNYNEIDLAWDRQKLVTKYLLQWGIKGQRSIFLKVTTKNRVILSNLLPNTNYEITVSSFDAKGKQVAEKSLSLKTPAAPLVKAVAGVQSSVSQVTPQVTPSIGTGISTRANQITQKTAKVSPTPAPSPQESSAPKEEQKTGWSRILVALAILIVAAGAAVGGYYGYEWYAGRHEDGDSSDSKSSRW